MRISGGYARGLNLKVPKIQDIRPAQDMVRLATFSILGEKIQGANVLDLYAGSGAYGLESLSRGANFVTFVDSHPLAIKAIESNLIHARFAGKAEVIRHDALRFLMDWDKNHDIIFIDPPYSHGVPKPVMYHLAEHLNPGGLLIFDHARTTTFGDKLENLVVVDQRHYGQTALTFFQRQADQAQPNAAINSQHA